MPRQRLNITLSHELRRALDGFAKSNGVTTSGVIEEAVGKHLGGAHNWDVLFRRLDRHTRSLERLQRDLDIMLEAYSVFVQLWFAHTPALPPSQQEGAKLEAWERFQKYTAFVAKQIASGKRFVEDLATPIGDLDAGEVSQAKPPLARR